MDSVEIAKTQIDQKNSNGSGAFQEDKIVSGEKKFKCKFCDQRFVEKSNLITHIRSHVGKKAFGCNLCGKKFSSVGLLQTHKSQCIITNKKPTEPQRKLINVCVICGMKFGDRNLFAQHESFHVNQRKFICRFCGVQFLHFNEIKSHILKQHMQQLTTNTAEKPKVTNNTKMECKMCKLVFADAGTFQRHMQKHNQPDDPSQRSAGVDSILQRLSSLGSEITLKPVVGEKQPATTGLGLVIASVQSVSMSYLDDLDKKSEELRRKRQKIKEKLDASDGLFIPKQEKDEELTTFEVSPEVVVEVKRRCSSSGSEDAVKKKIFPKIEKNTEPPTSVQLTEIKIEKVPKTEKIEDDKTTEISPLEPQIEESLGATTRRSSSRSQCSKNSAASLYREEDQPPSIKKIVSRTKNRVTKRRIFPCGQCIAKFENIESRKMHVITVHLSKLVGNPHAESLMTATSVQQQQQPPMKKRKITTAKPAAANKQPVTPVVSASSSDPLEVIPDIDPFGEVQTEPFSYIEDVHSDDEVTSFSHASTESKSDLTVKIRQNKGQKREQ